MMRNLTCVLPDGYIVVSYWANHPCSNAPYMVEAVCWGKAGAVGRWFG